jgi:hypothetical protein
VDGDLGEHRRHLQRCRPEHLQNPPGAAMRPHDGHRFPESRALITPFRVAIQTMAKPRLLVIVRLARSSGLSVSIVLLISPLGSLETCLRHRPLSLLPTADGTIYRGAVDP